MYLSSQRLSLPIGLQDMAGISVITEGTRDGRWYVCSDGKLMEPIDILHLLFPNEGRDSSGVNVCFVPRRFTFPPLRALLPDPTGYFVPDDLVDSIVVLTFLCVLVTVGLILCKLVWEKVDPRFAAISPPHKKWYVVANLSKTFFLAAMALGTRYWVGAYRSFYLDKFPVVELKRCSMLFMVTDLVALYMVPKLPRSTKFHHVATSTLCLLFSSIDPSIEGWGGLLGVSKMTILYGMFSTIPFTVNAYLGLRVVYPEAKWLAGLARLSLWLYITCCAVNWTTHSLWLGGLAFNMDISVATVLYFVPISVMINDDITLIKWLWKRSSPMAAKEAGDRKKD